MLGHRDEIPHLQSDFYRLKFHKILDWCIGLLFVIFLLLLLIVYAILFTPATQYYANTTDGRILSMPKMK